MNRTYQTRPFKKCSSPDFFFADVFADVFVFVLLFMGYPSQIVQLVGGITYVSGFQQVADLRHQARD